MLGTRLVGLVPVVPVRVWSGEEAENDGLVITTRDSTRVVIRGPAKDLQRLPVLCFWELQAQVNETQGIYQLP